MIIESVQLHFLQIPFRLRITHGARADRAFSDSIVVRVRTGRGVGHGEAVVREYVSGSLGAGDAMREEAVRIVSGLLAPLRGREIGWADAAERCVQADCGPEALPLLCGVESALLACAAEESRRDPWTVLGLEPVRTTVVYGGVFPMLPPETAARYLQMCAKMGIRDLKVKVGPDARANEAVLSLCRTILGAGCDLRVDANSTWAPAGVDEQARICERHGVRVIEQPFAAGSSEAGDAAARLLAARGFRVMADEGVLTAADVRTLASRGTAQMLNLRLSKNGGLVRLLSLAQEADACGLGYQLGCMVGETGILSCLGRVAASLLPHPVYLEGGYDDLLLEQNITVPSFGFGPGGKAEVVRAAGMGYRVDEERLTAFTRACLPV